MDRVDFTDFIPTTYVPMPLLMQGIVSFHMQLLMATSSKDEAIFHWRQIWYYYDYVKEINVLEDLVMQWDSRESFIEYLKNDTHLENNYLLEAIERFDLINVE